MTHKRLIQSELTSRQAITHEMGLIRAIENKGGEFQLERRKKVLDRVIDGKVLGFQWANLMSEFCPQVNFFYRAGKFSAIADNSILGSVAATLTENRFFAFLESDEKQTLISVDPFRDDFFDRLQAALMKHRENCNSSTHVNKRDLQDGVIKDMWLSLPEVRPAKNAPDGSRRP